MPKSSHHAQRAAASFPECGAALYLFDPEQMREYLRGYAFVAALAFAIALIELIVLAI